MLFQIKKYCVENLKIAIVPWTTRRRRVKGHPFQTRHKQDWDEGLIFLPPQAAVLLGSDAGSDVVKPASSFVIQNRQTSCFVWYLIYGARYYNVVCSFFRGAALAIDEGARPHLCIDKWNRLTLLRWRLRLTQAVRNKLTPTGLELVLSMKVHGAWMCSRRIPRFTYNSFTEKRRCLARQGCLKHFAQFAQTGV